MEIDDLGVTTPPGTSEGDPESPTSDGSPHAADLETDTAEHDAALQQLVSQIHFSQASIRSLRDANFGLSFQEAMLHALNDNAAYLASLLCFEEVYQSLMHRTDAARATATPGEAAAGAGDGTTAAAAAAAAAAAVQARLANGELHRTVLASDAVGGNPHHAAVQELFDAAWTGQPPPQQHFAAVLRISPAFFAELCKSQQVKMKAILKTIAIKKDPVQMAAFAPGVRQVITLREQLRRYACIHEPLLTVKLWQASIGPSQADILARRSKQTCAVELLHLKPDQVAGITRTWEFFVSQMSLVQNSTLSAPLEFLESLVCPGDVTSIRAQAKAMLDAMRPIDALKDPAARRLLVYDTLVSNVIACLTWQQSLVLAVTMAPYSADHSELVPQLLQRWTPSPPQPK